MSDYWWRHGDAANLWDEEVPPGGQACSACGTPTESEPCPDHQPYAVARQWLDVDGLLAELAESPLPGAHYAYEVVKRRLIKDAMDADRPAGDQTDSRRAMVTPREAAEAGTGQKHRPEGSIASIALDNQTLLDHAHHRACIFQSHLPTAPCIGYAGAWHVHVLGPDDDVIERLDRPGNRADGRR